MKLIDAVRHVDEVDGLTVCLRRPWTADSDACLVSVAPMSKIPEQVLRDGYEYFIEGAVLREVLEIPEAARSSENEKVALIIYYAENDAYPPWIYTK